MKKFVSAKLLDQKVHIPFVAYWHESDMSRNMGLLFNSCDVVSGR